MRYVGCASSEEEHSVTVFQHRGRIYYRARRALPPGTQLLVWIGEEYTRTLGLQLGNPVNYEFGEKDRLMRLFQELQPPISGSREAASLLPKAPPPAPKLVGLGRAQSRYWTFFGFPGDAQGRIADKSKIICKLCGVRLSYSGNTTNLRQHLVYKHRREYNQLVGGALEKSGDPPALGRTTRALAEFIVWDLMPVEVVEGEGFGHMLGTLDPSYKPPAASVLAGTVLGQMYRDAKGKLAELLRAQPHCSLSLAMWRHSAHLAYLTVTVHYVDAAFEAHAWCLSSRPVAEDPSPETVVGILAELAEEWGVRETASCAVGAHGHATKQAAAALGWTALPCVGEALKAGIEAVLGQPAVQVALEKCRRVASRVASGPGRGEDAWQCDPQLQGHLGHFLRDGAKWHGIYPLLQGLLDHAEALGAVSADGQAVLRPQDWAALQDASDVLKPLSIATSTFTKESFASLSLVKPILTSLLFKHLAPGEWDSQLARDAKAAAQRELSLRFSEPAVDRGLNLACALDPRFRGLDFVNQADRMETLHLLQIEASKLAQAAPAAAAPPASSPSLPAAQLCEEAGIEFLLGGLCGMRNAPGTTHQQAELESASFQSGEALALAQEPLRWWRTHHSQYPLLARAARKLLAVPATSAPAARLFSQDGEAFNAKCQSLSPEHVDMLLFLHANRAAL
uniref:BED-type domain-containing protein n=1 Tax=Sphenodon punctatus TaxID=8508 RepID=A0A8D0L4Y7_SPHPU